jgi:hypothetical protein
MRLPSGDQSGLVSGAGSFLNREGMPRNKSNSQMSVVPVWVSVRSTATRLSSRFTGRSFEATFFCGLVVERAATRSVVAC